MNRAHHGILQALVAAAISLLASTPGFSEDQMVTPWGGRCALKKPLPDVVCVMRRDVRSPKGVEASILYGQEEVSRYLRIELRRPAPDIDKMLVLRMGDTILKQFDCGDSTCAVVVVVDGRLLRQLAKTKTLTVKAGYTGDVLVRIPFDDFERARKMLL